MTVLINRELLEYMKLVFLFSILACLFSGCASTRSLPQSATEVDFNRSEEGKTGWAEWQDTMRVRGVDRRTAYQAAKSGLADAGFTIRKPVLMKDSLSESTA